MKHRFRCPSALIEVAGIFGKSARIERVAGSDFRRPASLPQIADYDG
jgi:hypothetical protein